MLCRLPLFSRQFYPGGQETSGRLGPIVFKASRGEAVLGISQAVGIFRVWRFCLSGYFLCYAHSLALGLQDSWFDYRTSGPIQTRRLITD